MATAYRMLFGHHPQSLSRAKTFWLGRLWWFGIIRDQLINAAGGNAIGVISDESKRDFVMNLGAKVC